MIAGKAAPRHGEAKNSWLTGTASWNYVAVTQYLLGIRPGYDGLQIHPCYPAHLGAIEVIRHFRGCLFHITLRPVPDGKTPRLTVDGHPVTSHFIQPQPGSEIRVVCEFECADPAPHSTNAGPLF